MIDASDFEMSLSLKCREMREGADLLLEALEQSPSLFTPEDAAAAYRLAQSTLAAVELYERQCAEAAKNPPAGQPAG